MPTIPTPRPTVLMTRPRAAAERFVESLRSDAPAFGAIYSPLIETVTTGPLPDLNGAGALIFTSGAGVTSYGALGGRSDLPCYTVGATTALAARAAGFGPRSADGDAEALVTMLCSETPPSPLVHIRGTYSRGDVAARLTAAGLPCEEVVIYDQPRQSATPDALTALNGEAPVIVPLFSPRTAGFFSELGMRHGSVHAISMSGAIADEVAHLPLASHVVSDAPTGESMRHAVLRHLRQVTLLEGQKPDG